jgi:glycosyltransferase involved in cell wall biosynthesis
MRVLIVHCSYKFRGGEDTVVSEEMNLLRNNGNEVQLLGFNNETNALIKLLQLPFNVPSYLKTRKKLRSYKPDIVHIHNLHFGASASVIYAIKKSRTPIVMTLHNFRLLCPSALLFHKGRLFLNSLNKKFPWKAVIEGVYQNSRVLTLWVSLSNQLHKTLGTYNLVDRFILLNDHSKHLFSDSTLAIPAGKISIKPNFCKVPKVVKYATSDYFLYIGRLSEEKGISLLLEAFSSTGFKIKIAGDGPLKNKVVDYSSRHTNIEYLGVLNKEEVVFLMNNCSALIFPSIWYEGLPLTIIEAFGSGTPVIGSKIGAIENMIIDKYNGLHFRPSSKDDLVKKLNEWQNLDISEREIYRLNSLNTYHKYYTPEINIKELMAVYNSVLLRKRADVLAPLETILS